MSKHHFNVTRSLTKMVRRAAPREDTENTQFDISDLPPGPTDVDSGCLGIMADHRPSDVDSLCASFAASSSSSSSSLASRIKSSSTHFLFNQTFSELKTKLWTVFYHRSTEQLITATISQYHD